MERNSLFFMYNPFILLLFVGTGNWSLDPAFFSLFPFITSLCALSLLLSVPPERSKQERARCTLRVRQNHDSSHFAAGLATLRQVLATPSAPCSIIGFCYFLSRYRNYHTPPSFPPHRHGAGCSIGIAIASPANATNIEKTIRNESDTSPPAVGERTGEGATLAIATNFKDHREWEQTIVLLTPL